MILADFNKYFTRGMWLVAMPAASTFVAALFMGPHPALLAIVAIVSEIFAFLALRAAVIVDKAAVGIETSSYNAKAPSWMRAFFDFFSGFIPHFKTNINLLVLTAIAGVGITLALNYLGFNFLPDNLFSDGILAIANVSVNGWHYFAAAAASIFGVFLVPRLIRAIEKIARLLEVKISGVDKIALFNQEYLITRDSSKKGYDNQKLVKERQYEYTNDTEEDKSHIAETYDGLKIYEKTFGMPESNAEYAPRSSCWLYEPDPEIRKLIRQLGNKKTNNISQ